MQESTLDQTNLTLQLLLLTLQAMFVVLVTVQTIRLSQQTRAGQRAAELSVNLELMTRLTDALLRIADDPKSKAYVWSKTERRIVENSRPQLACHALIDVLSIAMSGIERLPGFAHHRADWDSYIRFVVDKSPNLRKEVRDHDWWPELTRYVEA